MIAILTRNYTTDWARSTGGRSLGIVMTDGRLWHGQKQFLLKQLRKFGFGKSGTDVIWEQAEQTVEFILSRPAGRVTVDSELFNTPVLNVLWGMLAGYTFTREDPKGSSISNDNNQHIHGTCHLHLTIDV